MIGLSFCVNYSKKCQLRTVLHHASKKCAACSVHVTENQPTMCSRAAVRGAENQTTVF